MDTKRKFLNGDIHWLENVNRIVPRKMELPLLLSTKIQIQKNLFGIKSRLFRHMQSYDYKFRSLASEPKQPIRALRPHSTSLPSSPTKTHHKITRIDRSLLDKSCEWKLPPNVYYRRLGDGMRKTQAGKLGPYQCFTVERDERTVRSHHAPKASDDGCKTDFYDLPSLNDINASGNLHKNKFLKAKRFVEMNDDIKTPPPTKYFPQNFSIMPPSSSSTTTNVTRSKIIEVDPVFYYPQTTVPEREMTFNKEPFPRPEPGRYNPHDVICRCHLKATVESTTTRGGDGNKSSRCPGKIDGEGHTHVFQSSVPRLVNPSSKSNVRRRRKSHMTMRSKDDMALPSTMTMNFRHRIEREPISFRIRSSIDVVNEEDEMQRDVRYNTMIRNRSLFSLKTGRPVAFLSASPRFEETTEKPIKLYEKPRMPSLVLTSWSSTSAAAATEQEGVKKSSAKRMTKKRLEELATPKNALPKRTTEKIKVYSKLPSPNVIEVEDRNSVDILNVADIQCGLEHDNESKLWVVSELQSEEKKKIK